MSEQKKAEEILKRNVIINHCITGLSSKDEKIKQNSLDEILKLHTNTVEYSDIKSRERWE